MSLLREVTDPYIEDRSVRDEWLARLHDDDDALRIAASLCIDCLSEAISQSVARTVLGLWAESVVDMRTSFCAIVDEPSRANGLVCCSSHSGTLADDDHFVRVMELSRFIDYYVGPTFGYSSTVPGDVIEVLDLFFGANAEPMLDDITTVWTGGRNRVWVTSYAHVQERVREDLGRYGVGEVGTLLNDLLGLGYERGAGRDEAPVLVGVIYPRACGIRAAQPTVFDATWTAPGGYYLSWATEDGWGRTHSCSGTLPGGLERVHAGVHLRLTGYSCTRFGESAPLKVDRDALLRETADRLSAAMRR